MDNLVNNRDWFCPKHLSDGGKTCYVWDCGEPARLGYHTCQDPAHEQAESRYSMSKGSTSRRLAACLKHQKIAQTQNEESSEDEEDDCMSDEEKPIEVENEEVAGEGHKDIPAEVKVKVQFGRKKTHNEQLFVAPCGMIIACKTFFRSEAYSSVLEMLKHIYPRQMLLPDHVSYDSSCIIQKMDGDDPYFDNIAFTVDVFHFFCKHSKKDEYCQMHCNPKEHPELVDDDGNGWFFNTSICKQTNNWIGKYLPMCREMRGDKYTFFLDELILC
ncbi:hypothetical protein EWM64_g7787 [Hericium alpestre]|uniref:CxC6 like cysteine cluster associated with KDZ domain-containing protein n=1 Tax=Hericium alpestre TaxID=135208 RepID=A0A4Y9ZMZ2_9AGAM|nr:hypothetical protein EWM64_g7787 [Hericium alpestre]